MQTWIKCSLPITLWSRDLNSFRFDQKEKEFDSTYIQESKSELCLSARMNDAFKAEFRSFFYAFVFINFWRYSLKHLSWIYTNEGRCFYSKHQESDSKFNISVGL